MCGGLGLPYKAITLHPNNLGICINVFNFTHSVFFRRMKPKFYQMDMSLVTLRINL